MRKYLKRFSTRQTPGWRGNDYGNWGLVIMVLKLMKGELQ